MKFFRKKKNKKIINMDNHKWSLGETTMNGFPLYIRFNTSITSDVYKEEFPIKVGFAVHFKEKNSLGLPVPDEVQEIDIIEDQIIGLINRQGVQALSLTTGGIRELIFYVQVNADIASIHQSLLRNVKTHKVQCQGIREPNWETYYEYTSG